MAIGNPLGFENTVTAGIVSGLHRSIPSGDAGAVDLLQTDAPISPGNSGGALVGKDGDVIGINVAYLPPGAGAVSLGFAIPAPTVAQVVEQLLEQGAVETAFLGIRPIPVTPDLAKRFDLPVEEGVIAGVVEAGSAAARAGMREGDVIVELGRREIRTVEDLFAESAAAAGGPDDRDRRPDDERLELEGGSAGAETGRRPPRRPRRQIFMGA